MALTDAQLAPAVEGLLAAEQVVVERLTKEGRRPIDVRAALVSALIVEASAAEAAAMCDTQGGCTADDARRTTR